MANEIKRIMHQLDKAENACCKAASECGTLMALVRPYLCDEWQENSSVIDQAGDGLVLLIEDTNTNYPMTDVITEILNGKTDIGRNDLTAI